MSIITYDPSGLGGPFLDGVQLNEWPPLVSHTRVEEVSEKQVASGAKRILFKGFRTVFTLEWTATNLCSYAQYEVLRQIANKTTEINWWPYPVTCPNSTFVVRCTGGFRLTMVERSEQIQGFQGELTLEELIIQPVIQQLL